MLTDQNILVIGGTGFIGSFVVKALLKGGHRVTVLSRKARDKQENPALEFLSIDLYKANVVELTKIFSGFDGIVYAAGVDERVTPKGDAYQFFARKNIQPMERVITAAKSAGVERMVLMNSMFSYLERTQPDLNLSEKHPYIRSRVDQRNLALAMADQDLSIYIFEVPYVFGGDSQHECQWHHLIDYIRMMEPLFVTKGGANMLHVKTLADATVAAICNDKAIASGSFAIGDENLTWAELFDRLCALMKFKKRHVFVTHNAMNHLSRLGGFFKQAFGINSGLDDRYMAELVTQNMFFNAEKNQQLFGFKPTPLDMGLQQAIDICPKQNLLKKVWDMAVN